MHLDPGSFFSWILLGLLAGWLAGSLTEGRGFGCLGNIAVGLVGAVIGGYLFSLLGINGASGFFGSLLIATIGAVALIVIASLAVRR